MILKEIAEDKNALPTILEILQNEREVEGRLLTETNSELSRALTLIDNPKVYKGHRVFVLAEIKKHYNKWANRIRCNFNVDGIP